MFSNRLKTVLAFCALVAFLFLFPSAAFAIDYHFKANLNPTPNDPNASGFAEWERSEFSGKVTLDVEVNDVESTNLVAVFINDRLVGMIEIDHGYGALKLDSSDGDVVPRVKIGSRIEIKRADDGKLILSGHFVQA